MVWGTVNGVAFLVASISSGLAIGFLGVYWMLMFAIGLTLLDSPSRIIAISEKGIIHAEAQTNHIDIRGTIRESFSLSLDCSH